MHPWQAMASKCAGLLLCLRPQPRASKEADEEEDEEGGKKAKGSKKGKQLTDGEKAQQV